MGPRVHSCCHLGMVMDFLPGDTLEEARSHGWVVERRRSMVHLPVGFMGLVYFTYHAYQLNVGTYTIHGPYGL